MNSLDKAIAFASGYWFASCNAYDDREVDYIDLNLLPLDVMHEGKEADEDDLVEIFLFTLSNDNGVDPEFEHYRILGRVSIDEGSRALTQLYVNDEQEDRLYIVDPHTCEIIHSV